VTGFKNIYGPNSLFEGGKSILKLLAVGTIVAIALIPMIPSLGGMIGMTPEQLASAIVGDIYSIGMRAAVAYLLIGIIDIAYQRYRTEKSMKMDKQEVKDEAKQQQLPAEVKGAMRRRAMMSRHSAITALICTSGNAGRPPSWPALAISMPIEWEFMSVTPAHDERPACQARCASATSCTIRPSSKIR